MFLARSGCFELIQKKGFTDSIEPGHESSVYLAPVRVLSQRLLWSRNAPFLMSVSVAFTMPFYLPALSHLPVLSPLLPCCLEIELDVRLLRQLSKLSDFGRVLQFPSSETLRVHSEPAFLFALLYPSSQLGKGHQHTCRRCPGLPKPCSFES